MDAGTGEGEMHEYTEYTPDERNTAEMRKYAIPLPGDLVIATNDFWADKDLEVESGTIGVVVAYARSTRAHNEFMDNVAVATANGRELSSDDYECLVDNEGPVVEWPRLSRDWIPGQAMSVIRRLDKLPTWTQELVKIHIEERTAR